MPRMDPFRSGTKNSRVVEAQYRNCICIFCPPRIPPKQKEEQMENSSPNPSFSICDIRIQKQISRRFGKSFPQKIVLPKEISPPPNQKCKEFFSFGVAEALRGSGGTIRAYEAVSSHHTLRACD